MRQRPERVEPPENKAGTNEEFAQGHYHPGAVVRKEILAEAPFRPVQPLSSCHSPDGVLGTG